MKLVVHLRFYFKIKDSLETLTGRYCRKKIRDRGWSRNYVKCYVKQMEKT